MITRAKMIALAAALIVVCGVYLAFAQWGGASQPPLCLAVKDVKLRIVEATFVTKLEGVSSRFEEQKPDQFRGLVLTIEVKKPAGGDLTLVAADYALHYRYGDSSDVAPCHGLSTFSTRKDEDRPMNLFKSGYGRTTTGLSTTKAETVFVDVFFMNMEPETSEIHLLVAQPVGATFRTTGWKP